jgi:hypothetical protein
LISLVSDDQPFEDHVAVVTALLNAYIQAAAKKVEEELTPPERRLIDYIISRSSSRMHDRMTTSYAKDLFDALKQLRHADFRDCHTPFVGRLKTSQLNRDKRFLKIIGSSAMARFLTSIKVDAPKLLAVKSESFITFYREEHVAETHDLLVRSLSDLRDSVELISSRRYIGGTAPAKVGQRLYTLESIVTRVECAAHLLWAFIYSSAAPVHFSTIRDPLASSVVRVTDKRKSSQQGDVKAKHSRKTTGSAGLGSMAPKGDGQDALPMDDINEELDGGLGEDLDEDEDNLHATSVDNADMEKDLFPIVRQYLRWMRRHVSHIEAIKTLCAMGRQLALLPKPPTLTVRVLAVAYPGLDMKPWQTVVQELWARSDDQTTTAQDVINALSDLPAIKAVNSELKFRGTLHCEACLMSLLETSHVKDLVSANYLFSIQQPEADTLA